MKLRLLVSAVICAGVALTVGGCMANETPGAQSLYDEAKSLYVPFKTRVTEVQRDIFDGEWKLANYGDFPEACQDGGSAVENTFRFVISVSVKQNLTDLPESSHDAAQVLSESLTATGWSDVRIEDVSVSDTASVTVWASDETQGVKTLMLNVHEGFNDSPTTVSLKAFSTCGNGDHLDLMDELFPSLDTPPEPETVVPSDEFRFGFDESGEPVMLRAGHAS